MKTRILSILILFIFLILCLFITNTYTGYTVYQSVQPDIQLNLIKTTYNSNEKLDGYINLSIKGPIEANTQVILNMNSKEDKKTILEILNSLYKTPSIEYGGLEITNSANIKTLEYNSAETKILALQLTKGAQLSEFSFKIQGLAKDNVFPSYPTIDILEDNIPDFIYLGTFTNFKINETISPGLDKTASKSYMQLSSQHYYCELIDLPYSKDFQISVNYRGSGSLNAKILQATPTDAEVRAYYLSNNCNIQSGSCIINLNKPIQGDNLICVYPTSENIELATEDQNPSKDYYGYKCDIEYLNQENESDICTPKVDPATSEALIGDFFITVKVADYSGILNTITSFNSDLDSINSYLANCEETQCTIPISIISNSKGIIKISDIIIKYGTITKDFLSDIIETPDTIYKIEGKDKINLIIPLSIFNLATPQITQNHQELKAKVSIGTKTDEEIIDIYKVASSDAASIASNIKNKFSSYTEQQKEVASSLGYNINSLLQQVENYQQQIQNILNSTLSNTEKSSQLNTIKQSLDSIQETTPTSIKIKKSIKNLPSPRATEVQDIYLQENQRSSYIKQQILNLQSNINIKTDLAECKIIINNSEEEITLIKKTISGVLTDVYLIEEISKSIASNINEIKFGTDNYEIIQQDPIVRYSVTSLPFTITYVVPGSVIDSYNELITLVIPKTISYEPSEAYQKVKCGDGICTSFLEDKIICPEDCMKKINWWVVIILFVILVGGIYYIHFYRGKMSFKEVITQKPEQLFKSKSDEVNLRHYVKKSIAHGVPKSRIKIILLDKGWSEKQIDYIFNTF